MKKSAVLLSLLTSFHLYAGSIDYLAEQDSEYFAHASMIGKIETSSAFYNPAGTAFLPDGTYFKINSQTIFKKYKMTNNYPGITGVTDEIKTGNHKSTYPSLFVPAVQFIIKNNDKSFFIHSGVAAGGGALKYSGGLTAFEVIGESIQASFRYDKNKNPLNPKATVNYIPNTETVGSSYYPNINFGISKKISPKLSFGGAIRLIYATRDLSCRASYDLSLSGKIPSDEKNENILVKLEAERKSYGIGGVLGFNYKLNDKLNIGFKYESEVELFFESKKEREGLEVLSNVFPEIVTSKIKESLLREKVISEWTDQERRNLPAVASIGFSYNLDDKITLLSSGNFYFIKNANKDNPYENYDNGYEFSFGIDYKLSKKVTLMAGYQYTHTGANENTYKDTDFALNANLYGIGIKYSPKEDRIYTLAYSFADYRTSSATSDISKKGTGTIFSKDVTAFGMSVEFKF